MKTLIRKDHSEFVHQNDMELYDKIYAIHTPSHNKGGIYILTHSIAPLTDVKEGDYPHKNIWTWSALSPYGGCYGIHLSKEDAIKACESIIYEFDNDDDFASWIVGIRNNFDEFFDKFKKRIGGN